MASLNLKNIYKVYPSGVTAVTDFNLDIEDKEFIVFVGPSGCGKSTTLRMIAGLEEISSGELYIDGNLVNNTAPKDRDIAMVFQNYALYPHMTVYDNMAFGLKLRKMPRAEIDKRVKDAARILGIEMYLSRKPKALSGGQRQRVALGRAIVREPKVFLLDEPLSNLDAKLRSQMRTEITKLHNRLATTFIYVTHDQIEAMTMGTRIVVMKDGFMQQVDTPINLYDHPINQFVAGFIGTPQMNFFSGKLVGNRANVSVVFGKEKVALPKDKANLIVNLDKYLNKDKEVIFGIRPEDIHDEDRWVKNGKTPVIPVKIDVVEALGSETLLYCKTRSDVKEGSIKSIVEDVSNLIAKVDSRSKTKAGDTVKVALDVAHCHLFDKETEITLFAKDEKDKANIEALQLKREEEIAKKALDATKSKKQTKAELAAEKKRAKMEKKNGKNLATPAPVAPTVAPVAPVTQTVAPVKKVATAKVPAKKVAPAKAPAKKVAPKATAKPVAKKPVAKAPAKAPAKKAAPKATAKPVAKKPAAKAPAKKVVAKAPAKETTKSGVAGLKVEPAKKK